MICGLLEMDGQSAQNATIEIVHTVLILGLLSL